MKRQFGSFVFRWILNSLGLWIAVRLLGSFGAELTGEETAVTFLLAGFVFSLVNAILKPIVIILSLPAILVTLGLFILVVNGFMVWLSVNLVPGIDMTFGASIVAGIIMSLVNYVVTGLVDLRNSKGS